MNISLTPELERQVQSIVDRGLYGSQSEVMRAALRLLLEREEERAAKLEALRRDLTVGAEQVQLGKVASVTADEIKSRGRRRLDASRPNAG